MGDLYGNDADCRVLVDGIVGYMAMDDRSDLADGEAGWYVSILVKYEQIV